MSKAFYILKHEHRIIERSLRALDGVCDRLGVGASIPAGDLLEVIDFITTFADQYHHGKEERILFPALERCGIVREGGPLRAMEHEHRIERGLIAALRQAVVSYREGDNEAVRRFVEAAHSYLHMLAGHIEKEDSILFRIADEILDDDEQEQIAEGFKELDVVLGPRSLQDFERLAAKLEEKWAV